MSAKFQGIGGNVVSLAAFQPGEKELIGYIYGGVEADYPLPCVPSAGTQATNALYQVYLTKSAWLGQIPATNAHEAIGYYTHGDPKVKKHRGSSARAAVAPPPECSGQKAPSISPTTGDQQ
jgi:hypothetical protein